MMEAPEPLDLYCVPSLSHLKAWKQNLLSYLSQFDNYPVFLPGGLYAEWLPLHLTGNNQRIQTLHREDKELQNKLFDVNPLENFEDNDSIRNSIISIRNIQLSEMLKIICNLVKNCDTIKINNECSSIDSIIQLISDLSQQCNETKNSNILQLGDIRFKASLDYNSFYKTLRSQVCANLKKKGDFVKGLPDFHMEQDEILSPTFEDVIVIWCLEKIDNRLPSKVNQAFGHQLINNVTLKDIQKEVFKYIPIFLQELSIQESETIDLMKVKSEDDKQNTISCEQEPKIKDDFLSDQVEKIKTPKEKSKPYWNEENLALLMEEENNDEDFDNDHDNRDDNTDPDVKEELPLELEDQTNNKPVAKKVKSENGVPTKRRKKRKVNYDDDPYVCQKCHQEFTSEEDMMIHISTHTDSQSIESLVPEKLPCSLCKKVFTKQSLLNNHMIKHNGCSCEICDEKFTSIKSLKLHMVEHNGPETYVCHECGKVFGRKDSLGKHIKRHNGRNLEKDSWTCHICGKIFNIKESFNGHLLWHKERFKCESCGRTYIGQNRLDNHLCKHYSCNECNKEFDKERNLKMHMRMHAGETMFSCNQCEGLFDTKRKLNKHKNSAHRERRKYVCDECPKSFKGSAALKAHKLGHSGLRPYACEHCERTFSQKPHLDKHKLVHNNEFPFPCGSCGKKFRSHGHVKYHIDTTKCGLGNTLGIVT